MDDFARDFLVQDIAQLKKKFEPEKLHASLQAFVELQPVVENVAKVIKRLLRGRAAMEAA